MTNEFSVIIHNYISDKIATTEKNIQYAEKKNDIESISYYEGQLKELNSIRQFMAEKIDLKTQKYY
jgi:hypothetical protein